MEKIAMTRAELEQALKEQRAENAALRAELARCSPVSAIPLPNQEQLVQLMQELYTAVVLSDGCGLVTWVSPGFTALCGLEAHDVTGRRPESFLRPASDEAQTLDYIRASLRAKAPFQYEARNPRPGDEAGWLRVKMQPIYNERSNAVIMASLLEDITEWKKTQSTLAESERRFQALAENVPGVLYEWRSNTDGTAHFSYVSPKLYELFGLLLADINHFLEFTHPDDADALQQSIEHSRRTQTPWTYEGRVLVPGQPLRWMRGDSLITGHDAEGTKYSGILQDITPLKLAQAALRESDLRLRLAVEGFGDGAWEFNLRTQQFFFSADYKAMLGYCDEEFPSQYEDWLTHVHPDDQEEAARTWAKCQCGETRQAALEYRVRCKGGAYKWVLSRALVTEYDAAGQALLLTGIHTDISELKKTQVALDASTRRLSTVIANFQEGLVLE
ncbi:MAG TPA: PAS domain-containing protein, partial [Hymenobacter sp.]